MIEKASHGWVQETNVGGGAPILRGLIGPSILIVVDGVQTEIADLGPQVARELVRLVDLSRDGRDDVAREIAHGRSELVGCLAEIEIEGGEIVGDHAAFSLQASPLASARIALRQGDSVDRRAARPLRAPHREFIVRPQPSRGIACKTLTPHALRLFPGRRY